MPLECRVQDVGGQDKLRPFWRHYYAGTSGVIFVVDSSDQERLEKVKAELHAVMQEEELEFSCCACSRLISFPLLLPLSGYWSRLYFYF